jgi:hypothetical protein
MSRKPLIGSLLILVACCFTPLRAAAPVEAPTQVLGIDLAPLIKQSAQHRERFAVDVPQRISTAARNANACVASGGANGDGWRGSLSLSGTMTVTRADPGSSIYTITCTGAPPASTAQTTVTFSAAPGTGGGGGGGGGGSLERYVIVFLLLLTAGRMQRWVKLPIRARMH